MARHLHVVGDDARPPRRDVEARITATLELVVTVAAAVAAPVTHGDLPVLHAHVSRRRNRSGRPGGPGRPSDPQHRPDAA
ncbi:MAG TPA: hypothetical protein VFW63_12805 [Acidimicrobiales bacterium]|nr:hypothetical protein [Acidimicrobiales bacterium]